MAFASIKVTIKAPSRMLGGQLKVLESVIYSVGLWKKNTEILRMILEHIVIGYSRNDDVFKTNASRVKV